MTNVIKKDDIGLYVRTGGYKFRPGEHNSYSHVYDMSDGGLVEGDRVKAHHRSQTPLAKIVTSDEIVLYWQMVE